MRIMPNIKLTEEVYRQIATQNKIAFGGEGIICRGENPNSIYKIFVEYDTINPVGMSDNKHSKVKELYQRQLEHSVQPLSTISLNGELIGYEMTYDEDDISLERISLFRHQLIRSLKETGEILKYYASQDITYGYVKANNILINKKTKKAKFCDMDNIRLGQYPIDLLNDYVDSIYVGDGSIDESVDAYMHNLMTLQKLNSPGITYDEIIYRLADKKYHKNYKEGAHHSLETMASSEPFVGEYIAPYIKR